MPLNFTEQELTAIEQFSHSWLERQQGTATERLKALQRELVLLQSRMGKGLNAYLDGKINERLWQTQSKEWMDQQAAIEGQMTTLRDSARPRPQEVGDFMHAVSHLHEWYVQGDGFERATILRAVTSNLKVGRENVEPVYRKWAALLAMVPLASPKHLYTNFRDASQEEEIKNRADRT